jgi:LPS sulfotransferase NodH
MDGLIGIPLHNLWKLMKENKFQVDAKYRRRFMILLLMSARNSIFMVNENRLFSNKIDKAEIPPLFFILGHWRSGTTLLHNLLSLDDSFAYPNLFQVSKPFVFLSRETAVSQALKSAEAQKRAMDNVEVVYKSPGEDESALAVGSLRSPYIGWSFPRRELFYDRYLTFQDCTATEKDEWVRFFEFFLRKLSIRYEGKPLILKSPTHTGRIKLILEKFPDSKFVHVHRNPYEVYQSTVNLYRTVLPGNYLQEPNCFEECQEAILRRYELMYTSYLKERTLIPENNLFEIDYNSLDADKFGTIAKIYEKLQLPGFGQLEPKLKAYVDTIGSYQRNSYNGLARTKKDQIYSSWHFAFDSWGYAK